MINPYIIINVTDKITLLKEHRDEKILPKHMHSGPFLKVTWVVMSNVHDNVYNTIAEHINNIICSEHEYYHYHKVNLKFTRKQLKGAWNKL